MSSRSPGPILSLVLNNITKFYNKGSQTVALQLVFVALGPFCQLKESLQTSN